MTVVPTAAGLRFYNMVAPLMGHDTANGSPGLALCDAAGAMLQNLDVITQDTATRPGWSAVADPDAAPADWLPWTAQLYGDTIPQGLTEQEQRDNVRDLPPQHRGTLDAIVTAVKRTLTGLKVVRVVERPDDDGYRLELVTYTAQTPDPAATLAAALGQKAGGITLFYATDDDVLIDEGEQTIDNVADTVIIDTVVYADVT